LLGPSGCGKSTLLNIIAGLILQDEGSVLLDGTPIDHFTPRERDVAVVFQSYALYPHMTVAGNLSFGLRMRKVPKSTIENRVLETARLLGIESLLERKPRELSGGQRQRVAMGRALVRRPKVFLLDEPLSNLDARLRANVRIELKQLHQKIKGTIMYVTHDQIEAMTLGDRVVVMRDGRIHQIDPPELIYTRPADTFVASFIGSPEINLYRGKMVYREQVAFFQGQGFDLALEGLDLAAGDDDIQLGVRPEDVKINDKGVPGFQAGVEMISDIGSEKYIHARLGEEKLILRAPKNVKMMPGDLITLAIDPRSLHLFQQGKRMEYRTNPSREF
ncbi:MAG: ATP-binding cassette domain-containing protein, partial [Deltaproteobacteria bacterium]|nr:ATP-binding cassette domain-containing protein [Deltaproteobacteria bacterium]